MRTRTMKNGWEQSAKKKTWKQTLRIHWNVTKCLELELDTLLKHDGYISIAGGVVYLQLSLTVLVCPILIYPIIIYKWYSIIIIVAFIFGLD